MKNSKLYESLSALTQKSLEIITKFRDKDPIVRTESTWIKQNNDMYCRQDIQRLSWASVLYKAQGEIERTKEFASFSAITKSDKTVSSQLNTFVGTCMTKRLLKLFNLVFKSVSPFLTNTEIVSFDESVFKTEYLKIENAFYSNEIEFEVLSPLGGFSMDINDFVLDNNLSIVKLSEPEIIDLLRLGINIGNIFGPKDYIPRIEHPFAIKLTYKLPKIVGNKKIVGTLEFTNSYIKREQEQKILNALRLFKEGNIYSLAAITKSNSVLSLGNCISYGFGTTSKPFMKNKFKLVGNEKNNFLEFWKVYQRINISEKHFLSVAIRRFSQSNERESIEDKIIDLFISAEALFLSSGGDFQGELRYRLSHRAAMFIEDETKKQREIFKFMQQAYDVRSEIVHGKKPKLPKKKDETFFSLDELCTKIETYLRVSLNKMIKQISTPKSSEKNINWDSIIFPTDN